MTGVGVLEAVGGLAKVEASVPAGLAGERLE